MTIYDIARPFSKGSSGEDVRVLQRFLIDNGFKIPAGPTGYYGDQTIAAVTAWQKSNPELTKKIPSGEFGFFGPISQSFLKSQQAQAPSGDAGGAKSGGDSQGGTGSGGKTTDGHYARFTDARTGKKHFLGPFASGNQALEALESLRMSGVQVQDPGTALEPGNYAPWSGSSAGSSQTGATGNFPYEDDPAFKGSSPSEQLYMRMMWDLMGKYAEQNKQVGSGTELAKEDLDRFMEEARQDKDIQKYYGDQLSMAQRDINNLVDFMKGEYTTAEAERQRKFTEQKKTLAEQEAEAGRAFSGFRRQATERLGQEQEGIVSSSRRQLQRNLYTYGSEFERKLGTAALPSLQVAEGIGYTPYGGVSGEFERAKQLDIDAKYRSLVQDALLRRGIT